MKDLKVAEDRGRILVDGAGQSCQKQFQPSGYRTNETTNQEAFIRKKLLNLREEQWEFFMFWPGITDHLSPPSPQPLPPLH